MWVSGLRYVPLIPASALLPQWCPVGAYVGAFELVGCAHRTNLFTCSQANKTGKTPWVLVASSSLVTPAQLLIRGPLVVNQLVMLYSVAEGDLAGEAEKMAAMLSKVDGLCGLKYVTDVARAILMHSFLVVLPSSILIVFVFISLIWARESVPPPTCFAA